MGLAARHVLGFGLLVGAAIASACAPLERADIPLTSHSSVHNNTNRSFRLFVPEGVRRAGIPAPLMLVLHGAGSVPDIAELSRITRLAERENFIVAFPQAVGNIWNDNAIALLAPNVATDVDFIRSMVADVAKSVPVDPGRIYAAGLSNGGMMALRLGCEAADLFAGVAAVAATMPALTAMTCRPARPVSVMLVNGTHDPIIPERGGPIRYLLFVRSGHNLSTDATMMLWAHLNDCAAKGGTAPLPDRDRRDGSRPIRVDYVGCRDSNLRLIRVANGGHTWPGSAQYLPRFMVGRVNRDFDATDAIWAFFKESPRR